MILFWISAFNKMAASSSSITPLMASIYEAVMAGNGPRTIPLAQIRQMIEDRPESVTITNEFDEEPLFWTNHLANGADIARLLVQNGARPALESLNTETSPIQIWIRKFIEKGDLQALDVLREMVQVLTTDELQSIRAWVNAQEWGVTRRMFERIGPSQIVMERKQMVMDILYPQPPNHFGRRGKGTKKTGKRSRKSIRKGRKSVRKSVKKSRKSVRKGVKKSGKRARKSMKKI